MDQGEKDELLRQVAETVRECRAIARSARTSAQERWEALAGEHLEGMMQSASATVQYLSSPEPELREAALHILNDHWGLPASCEPVLERLALRDTNEDVRAIALLYFVSLYHGTNDKRIGKLLATYVKDVSLSKESRTTAYYCLFRLRGLSSEHWPEMWSAAWRFPDDVNWAFVNSFA
jgi:hypothetical protein